MPKVVVTIPFVGYILTATESTEGLIVLGLVVLFLIILYVVAELLKKEPEDEYEDLVGERRHVKTAKELRMEEKERAKRMDEEDRELLYGEKARRKQARKEEKKRKKIRTGGFVDEIYEDDLEEEPTQNPVVTGIPCSGIYSGTCLCSLCKEGEEWQIKSTKKFIQNLQTVSTTWMAVYRVLGSSLGRTFTGNRDTTIRTLSMLMYTKPDGHLLRSELALISNMARTIKDESERSRLMTEYDEILKEIEQLPNMFGSTDIIDAERVALNLAARREKLSENDHLVICISRTQGSAGNDIGFELADNLHINYYDVEIFDQVLKRLEAEKGDVQDKENFTEFNKYGKKSHESFRTKLKELNRYHGLNKQDAVFFNMSDLICELARTEDCLIIKWSHFAFCFLGNINSSCRIGAITASFHSFHKILKVFLQTLFIFLFCHFINSTCFILIHSFMNCPKAVYIDVGREILNFPVGYICFRNVVLYSKQFIYHDISSPCLHDSDLLEAIKCTPLSSAVISSFFGTMRRIGLPVIHLNFYRISLV